VLYFCGSCFQLEWKTLVKQWLYKVLEQSMNFAFSRKLQGCRFLLNEPSSNKEISLDLAVNYYYLLTEIHTFTQFMNTYSLQLNLWTVMVVCQLLQNSRYLVYTRCKTKDLTTTTTNRHRFNFTVYRTNKLLSLITIQGISKKRQWIHTKSQNKIRIFFSYTQSQ